MSDRPFLGVHSCENALWIIPIVDSDSLSRFWNLSDAELADPREAEKRAEAVASGVGKSYGVTAALRFVSNVVAYLNENPGEVTSCEAEARHCRRNELPLLRPPGDVSVTADLKTAAQRAAQADSLGGLKRAMAHFVRGHWRNQPCGEGRQEIRRTWVRPHKRGDESLGRVVERITKLTGKGG